RACSILEKAKEEGGFAECYEFSDSYEIALAKHIAQFPYVIEKVVVELRPQPAELLPYLYIIISLVSLPLFKLIIKYQIKIILLLFLYAKCFFCRKDNTYFFLIYQ
ncbi:MAG: hypothetical protein IJ937_04815, partial [Treponema sp.]|nr:hypothetical protein [Treponema sp.]